VDITERERPKTLASLLSFVSIIKYNGIIQRLWQLSNLRFLVERSQHFGR